MTPKEKALAKFGAHLRKVRQEQGLSIHQLAATSQLEYGQLQKIEKGKTNLTLFTLLIIAEALEVPPDTLLKY